MAARVSKDGATITGSDMVYNYQQVLRQIVYTNRKPAYYLNRVFKLTCSELNGRFTSNEYVQTVSFFYSMNLCFLKTALLGFCFFIKG